MALKRVAKLKMDFIRRQSDENDNRGIRQKVDTEIYQVMSLTFLIDTYPQPAGEVPNDTRQLLAEIGVFQFK